MNVNYSSSIPADFHDSSRVWVYQAARPFSSAEATAVQAMLHNFAAQWQSHGTPVKGFAGLFFDQFIIFMADETAAGVSGCSTDSSVRIIKQVEEQFAVNMFDRQLLAFIIKDKVELLPLSQMQYAVQNEYIHADTLYFNNLVASKKDLLNTWLVPVQESWLAARLRFTEKVSGA